MASGSRPADRRDGTWSSGYGPKRRSTGLRGWKRRTGMFNPSGVRFHRLQRSAPRPNAPANPCPRRPWLKARQSEARHAAVEMTPAQGNQPTFPPARMSKPTQAATPENAASEPGWLDLVRQHVGSLRYGVVQIIVHDSHVTQIEKTERVRLARPRPDNDSADQPTGSLDPNEQPRRR